MALRFPSVGGRGGGGGGGGGGETLDLGKSATFLSKRFVLTAESCSFVLVKPGD